MLRQHHGTMLLIRSKQSQIASRRLRLVGTEFRPFERGLRSNRAGHHRRTSGRRFAEKLKLTATDPTLNPGPRCV